MNETFRATYRKGVLVPLQNPGLKEQQVVRLQIVPAQVKVSAAAARQKVNHFLLDEISYLLGAEQPTLLETDFYFWRVSISLTSPDKGVIGQVGSIDVNAETGELLLADKTIAEITHNARNLAGGKTSTTTAAD